MDLVKMTENECLESGMEIIYRKEYAVPGSIASSITSFALEDQWPKQDSGMLHYNYAVDTAEPQTLDLRFCVTGNRYCNNEACKVCSARNADSCPAATDTLSLFNFRFTPNYLNQFVSGNKEKSKKEHVLAFEYKTSFVKLFPVCPRQRTTLSALLERNYTGTMENIFINSKIHEILLYSMDCLIEEKNREVFTCRFLADDAGLDKIQQAKDILLQNLDSPITIKELSKRVAINECYLKKGFKEVFGTTIFDFYQQQRMDHAKYLLYQKGLSVTDVAAILGYSTISHFSAAFKKQTGIKPCELLLRP
ncbi:MAG TPA: AraC family transcriptional regulator [Arachidicoccus sp.]|nr:AraC family transcriptional regulator [Arachidicoccus sp.]